MIVYIMRHHILRTYHEGAFNYFLQSQTFIYLDIYLSSIYQYVILASLLDFQFLTFYKGIKSIQLIFVLGKKYSFLPYTHMEKNNSETQKKTLEHPRYDRQFMQKGLNMTLNFVEETLKGQNKVVQIKQPEQLKKQIDMTINQEATSNDRLLQLLGKILQKQTKPYHPHFHNQLFGGFDQYSVLGAMMAPAINGSVYTYEVAPCFTLMEYEVYEMFRKLLGWESLDGIFTPGGSFANFMAITTSRYNLNPNTKKKGNGSKPLKIFTSETSHYSMKKGAHFCGIGQENVVYVKSDKSGKMIPSQLEKAIEKQTESDHQCLLVNATFGTTVEGVIDPIEQLGHICKKHKIWFHVDAALGGVMIFSPEFLQKNKKMFENVDSITIDPHKGLLVPLQLSLFLSKRHQILFPANSAKADYLFHKQRASYSGHLDIGDKSFQCGRVIDILKFWSYLKGNGMKGIAQQVNNEHKLAQYVKKYVNEHPQRWILVVEEVETFNICFWYVPKGLNKKQFLNEDHFYARLSQVTVLAKKFMIEGGKMLMGYSKTPSTPHYFWRSVMSNPYISQKDVDQEMQWIGQYCEKALAQILEGEKDSDQ